MSDECPRMETTALIRRFAAGDDDALAEYVVGYKGKLVRAANRSLRKLRIDEADLDVEGAVDMAFGEICQLRDHGTLDSMGDSNEFLKLMIQHTKWIINDQKKRSDAAKRGGQRAPRRVGARGGRRMGPEWPRLQIRATTEHRLTSTNSLPANRRWRMLSAPSWSSRHSLGAGPMMSIERFSRCDSEDTPSRRLPIVSAWCVGRSNGSWRTSSKSI